MSKEQDIVEGKPDLEIRRFKTIYTTFLKLNKEQRLRAINYMVSKYNSDNSKQFNGIKNKRSNIVMSKVEKDIGAAKEMTITFFDILTNWANENNNRETIPRKEFLNVAKLLAGASLNARQGRSSKQNYEG